MLLLSCASLLTWLFPVGIRYWLSGTLLTLALLTAIPPPPAQVLRPGLLLVDTLHKSESLSPSPDWGERRPFFQQKLVRASLVPALLIGFGASTINGNGLHSSYDAKHDIQHLFGSYRN